MSKTLNLFAETLNLYRQHIGLLKGIKHEIHLERKRINYHLFNLEMFGGYFLQTSMEQALAPPPQPHSHQNPPEGGQKSSYNNVQHQTIPTIKTRKNQEKYL